MIMIIKTPIKIIVVLLKLTAPVHLTAISKGADADVAVVEPEPLASWLIIGTAITSPLKFLISPTEHPLTLLALKHKGWNIASWLDVPALTNFGSSSVLSANCTTSPPIFKAIETSSSHG